MNTEQKTVFLDLDGVCANLLKSLCSQLNKDYDTLMQECMTGKDWPELMGLEDQALWDHINDAEENFWAEFEPYPWFPHMYHELKKQYDVVFLTSPGNSKTAASGKVRWLHKHINKQVPYIITRKKHFCAAPNRLLVDDSIKQIKEFSQAGGKTLHFPQPWSTQVHTAEFFSGAENVASGIRKIIEDTFRS
jgi:5'(3')-deoxyribonucleotidase